MMYANSLPEFFVKIQIPMTSKVPGSLYLQISELYLPSSLGVFHPVIFTLLYQNCFNLFVNYCRPLYSLQVQFLVQVSDF